ncbi:acyl-CoA thioesterase [Thalassococcus sp. BH17M4-6]|uniref:acyl-CoA thioesterase n=1 Tax=Thalassococcus sp. BH17M4-6 TaxID=3413148 RepID=UPI003BE6A3C1
MPAPYRIAVPFRDVDMHGHMHNAAHVSHFEAAISHFLREAGLSDHFRPDGAFVFHVRKVEVLFHAPSRYDDLVQIDCPIRRLGRSSLGFAPRMTGEDGTLRATAEIVWVCVARGEAGSATIPDNLRAALQPYFVAQAS